MRRPVHPLIPYPPEAIQHTRCVLALTVVTLYLSLLKPDTIAGLGELGAQVQKVERRSERCADDTQRRLSAGAKRELDGRFRILAEHVDSGLTANDADAKWATWASGVWAGLTFLEDARNTCPVYFRGLHWHNLLKTLTTLCNALEQEDPRIAEIGTRLYERTA